MAESTVEKSPEATEGAWDDALLIKAYDSSIKLAKDELARRIAIATNTHKQTAEMTSEEAPDSSVNLRSISNIEYKVGDFARATYLEDGNDYEGQIISVDETTETCLMRFVGYENEQHVPLGDLVPSWGKKARRKQCCRAKQTDEPQSESGNEHIKHKKKSKSSRCGGRTSCSAVPPPPPMPPMLLGQNDGTEESQHLSAMLMSWYMSGYYTGVYQGMKLSRDKKNARAKKQK